MEYLELLAAYFASYPYILVLAAFFLLLFLVPIPEELILFTGGLLAAGHGQMSWLPTLICGIVGVFITDYWYFLLAKRFGRNFLNHKIVRRLFSPPKQQKALQLVSKYGIWAVFIVRFIPGGIRNPCFFVCGLSTIKSKNFIIASLSGAAIVSQISFWLGYFLHDTWVSPDLFLDRIEQKVRMGIGLIGLVILLYILVKRVFGKSAK